MKMKKWEYKTIVSASKGFICDPTSKFNKLGQEGWEAVGISHREVYLITLFKKEI